MTNIWADTFSAIREPHFSEEKKEKEEKGEKKHKEGPAEEKAEKNGEKETEDGKKRWWDDDGDGKGWEKGEVSGSFKKKVKKEERELHSKNDKNDKLDVRKGIHNKINTKPTVTEEVEAWIDELLSEGYDLSKFTLDEIVDIYESAEVEQLDEADTYGMAPKGDAERQKPDPMSAAKARAARAKVSKEKADFQVAQQAQRMKVSTTESVLEFVEGRTPLFEARFDPKKSKLRPASERTKTVMTDAQRKAAKKEAERTAEIHSKGETVLAGLRSSGKTGKVKTTPDAKSSAPAANRKVKGKYDKLASAADKILKDLQVSSFNPEGEVLDELRRSEKEGKGSPETGLAYPGRAANRERGAKGGRHHYSGSVEFGGSASERGKKKNQPGSQHQRLNPPEKKGGQLQRGTRAATERAYGYGQGRYQGD